MKNEKSLQPEQSGGQSSIAVKTPPLMSVM